MTIQIFCCHYIKLNIFIHFNVCRKSSLLIVKFNSTSPIFTPNSGKNEMERGSIEWKTLVQGINAWNIKFTICKLIMKYCIDWVHFSQYSIIYGNCFILLLQLVIEELYYNVTRNVCGINDMNIIIIFATSSLAITFL